MRRVCLLYTSNREKCIPLMDNGHYHPTEVVSDKIPALLAFFPEIALHITRPSRPPQRTISLQISFVSSSNSTTWSESQRMGRCV